MYLTCRNIHTLFPPRHASPSPTTTWPVSSTRGTALLNFVRDHLVPLNQALPERRVTQSQPRIGVRSPRL